MNTPLPPGQFELDKFPRFGLGKFARRFPANPSTIDFEVRGDVATPLRIREQVADLPRIELRSDFHCVTTWSVRNRRWTGVSFSDFYHCIVLPSACPQAGAELVVFRGQDGYASSLPLADLLNPGVMLANGLDGESLGLEHGAPLRLIAPAHYGYKNVKHIAAIEFWRDRRAYRFPSPYPAFMDHPRARVAFEERGKGVPGWLLRWVYRLLVGPTIRNFRKALRQHRESQG
ncbi:MAG: molybdopterin-dependent oxidoreductase [Panacagrimonas sp.]